MHAKFLVQMIHKTVDLLGVDDDMLTENMVELGKKHVAYGVKPEYFPFMTEALLIMLKQMLQHRFTDTDKQAWENVLAVLIADMVKGQRKIDKGLVAACNKKIVINSWIKLTRVDNYEERAGSILFQK
jgi:hemoglobin-like flavoprotein